MLILATSFDLRQRNEKTFDCINWNLLWVCWRVILADLSSGTVGLAGWGNDRQNANWSTMEESLIKNTQHTLHFHPNRWQWRLSAAHPPPPDSSSQTGLLLSPSQVCSSGTLGSYRSEHHRFPMDWKENKQQYLCIIHTWNSSTCCAVTLNFLLELFGKAGCKKHGTSTCPRKLFCLWDERELVFTHPKDK